MNYKLTVGQRCFYGPGYDAVEILKARGVFKDAEVTYRGNARKVDKFEHIDVMLNPFPETGHYPNCEYTKIGDNLFIIVHDSDLGLFIDKFEISNLKSRRGSLKLSARGGVTYAFESLEKAGVAVRQIERNLSRSQIRDTETEESAKGGLDKQNSNSECGGRDSLAKAGAVNGRTRLRSGRCRDFESKGIRESNISDRWDRIRALRESHISRRKGET